MAGRLKSTEKLTLKQTRFLAAYSRCGSISHAAVIVGASRNIHYKAMKKSARYRAAFEQAQEDFADLLRDAATHRAVRGVKRKKFYQGLPCMVPVLDRDGEPVFNKEGEPVMEQYVEVEYSDQLLIQLLRAHCPEFVEKQRLEHSGPDGGPIPSEHRQDVQFTHNINELSAENLKHLASAPKPTKPAVRKKAQAKPRRKA